jgi:hypothetical protein
MKRTFVLLTLLLVLASGAHAHEGMLALFTNENASDCDANLAPFEVMDVHLFYVRGDGPEMGGAFEFRIAASSDFIEFGVPTWHPSVEMHALGSLEEGIAVAASHWLGVDLYSVYLGTIPVINTGEEGEVTVSIVDHPGSIPEPGIFITLTDHNRSKHRVHGGVFVFNGTCVSPLAGPTATESSTWGAIKSMVE